MGGKVVQLVQGREKALEGEHPHVMLERFHGEWQGDVDRVYAEESF